MLSTIRALSLGADFLVNFFSFVFMKIYQKVPTTPICAYFFKPFFFDRFSPHIRTHGRKFMNTSSIALIIGGSSGMGNNGGVIAGRN